MVSQASMSSDTQSVLLLCAQLRTRARDTASPLKAAEYDLLASALYAEGLRPGDLLSSTAGTLIPKLLARLPQKTRERLTFDRISQLLARGGQLALSLSHWRSAGIWIISRGDERYPSRYKKKLGSSRPPIVYGIGPSTLLERGGLAVVGSRKPDESSRRYTTDVGRWAAAAGVQIVSGAARGVDERSMLACVGAGGTALGIVAESLLKLSTRRDFRDAILSERLTLISSFDPETGFNVGNAMGRNRWIYALADHALVVACSEGRGGTWAGAIEALRRGVCVYVRTGNPDRPGNEKLLDHGATRAPETLSSVLLKPLISPEKTLSMLQLEVPSTPLAASVAPRVDIYEIVVPELLRHLREPITKSHFAASARLLQAQADAWLRRLLSEGHIDKAKTLYRSAHPWNDSLNVGDVYTVALPELLHHLRMTTNTTQFATSVTLTRSQAGAWLTRMVADGHVEKIKTKYVAAGEQRSLFETDDSTAAPNA